MGWGGWGGGVGWDVNAHCDCNHIVRSPALPHIRHAALLHVLLHFHKYVMLRCCTSSCTSTRMSCYAAARPLALPHIRHATSRTACYADGCKFAKLGKEPPNNKCQKNASNGKTLHTTAVSL